MGLEISNINHCERQNLRSAQKLTFPKDCQCIQGLIDGRVLGHPPNATLLGTKTYLLVVWYYVEIFCSEEASLKTRIKYAAIVAHFLTVWCNWVHGHHNLQLTTNFITRVTYIDIFLSVDLLYKGQLPP